MKTRTLLLSLFVLLKFVLQFYAIDASYELHRDEFLHIDLGKHMAWGYSSVPPVTALISYLILHFGSSVFLIKFIPALFGALTLVVVWKTIEELKGNLFALVLGAVSITLSVLLRINTLYQPNSLEILLWTVLFYFLVKFIHSGKNKWLYLASVTMALGFLNKYNIAFLMLGLLPAVLITDLRKVFLNKHLYFSLLLALLIVAPNLIWQYNNNFPVLEHLQTLSETQLVNVSRTDFLVQQLLFFLGSLFVLVVAFLSFFTYPPFSKYRVFFWTYLFTIILFTYFKAKGYYAIGLYPVFLAFGAVYLEKLLSRGWRKYLRLPAVLIPVAVMLPLMVFVLPVLSPEQIVKHSETFKKIGLLRWEDGKDHTLPQDFADMLGWTELAHLVDLAYENTPDKEHVLVHCDNYGQAGAINYYTSQKKLSAYSMNADYINWYPLDEFEIKHVILVKHSSDNDKNREKELPFFEEITLVGEIKNPFARECGTKVYLLKGAKISVNQILRQEIQERKD